MKAPLAALSFLAMVVGAFAWLVPYGEVPYAMWVFVYLVLATSAVYAWRHSNAPAKPSGWLLLVVAVTGLGAVLAGIESLIFGPKSGIVMLDVLVIAAASLVACSGAVYSAFKRKPE